MIARLALLAALLALSPAAHADRLSGWWNLSGSAKGPDGATSGKAKTSEGSFVRTPSEGSPNEDPIRPATCRVEGQLAMKEGKAAECSLTLTYSCSEPDRQLLVVQTCSIAHKGDTVTIRGGNPEIAKATPKHLWPTAYAADTMTLKLSKDGKSLTGELFHDAGYRVSLTKIMDLAG